MFRILSKIHTISNNFYEMYSVINDKGETTEYGVKTLEEAKKKAKELLCKKGYCDLKIMEDNIYHIDIIDGAEVKPEVEKYSIKIEAEKKEGVECTIIPNEIKDIEAGTSVEVGIKFSKIIPSFHLIIDGNICAEGIPSWIDFKVEDATSGILCLNGITQNHTITIVID